jgi:hypothetical protein
MPAEVPPARPEGPPSDDATPRKTGKPPEAADVASDTTPSEQRATATWVQSTDASGTVTSKREVPEPDSPGG